MTKKKRISVASGKDKGRRLQKWVCEQIGNVLDMPWGKDELIASRPMGQAGTDVVLKGIAARDFPFSIECKYQEAWSIPAWIKQAKTNMKKNTNWLLFLKRNQHEEVVVMDAKFFFEMYKEYITPDDQW